MCSVTCVTLTKYVGAASKRESEEKKHGRLAAVPGTSELSMHVVLAPRLLSALIMKALVL